MTQHEAEAIVHILKRRMAEERITIENAWKFEKSEKELDRKHTMERIEKRLFEAQLKLTDAHDKIYKVDRKSENWKSLAISVNQAKAAIREIYNEREELSRYYQNVFRELRDKRDHKLRAIVIEYGKERARIMDKVEHSDREDRIQYWRDKYYKLKAEVDKLKEGKAA